MIALVTPKIGSEESEPDANTKMAVELVSLYFPALPATACRDVAYSFLLL